MLVSMPGAHLSDATVWCVCVHTLDILPVSIQEQLVHGNDWSSFTCGSSIVPKHQNPVVNFESLGIIPQLLDEVELSFVSTQP